MPCGGEHSRLGTSKSQTMELLPSVAVVSTVTLSHCQNGKCPRKEFGSGSEPRIVNRVDVPHSEPMARMGAHCRVVWSTLCELFRINLQSRLRSLPTTVYGQPKNEALEPIFLSIQTPKTKQKVETRLCCNPTKLSKAIDRVASKCFLLLSSY